MWGGNYFLSNSNDGGQECTSSSLLSFKQTILTGNASRRFLQRSASAEHIEIPMLYTFYEFFPSLTFLPPSFLLLGLTSQKSSLHPRICVRFILGGKHKQKPLKQQNKELYHLYP